MTTSSSSAGGTSRAGSLLSAPLIEFSISWRIGNSPPKNCSSAAFVGSSRDQRRGAPASRVLIGGEVGADEDDRPAPTGRIDIRKPSSAVTSASRRREGRRSRRSPMPAVPPPRPTTRRSRPAAPRHAGEVSSGSRSANAAVRDCQSPPPSTTSCPPSPTQRSRRASLRLAERAAVAGPHDRRQPPSGSGRSGMSLGRARSAPGRRPRRHRSAAAAVRPSRRRRPRPGRWTARGRAPRRWRRRVRSARRR